MKSTQRNEQHAPATIEPVLMGYFPRRTVRRGGALPTDEPSPFPRDSIVEICSVSACISKGPQQWSDNLGPNPYWGFDSPAVVLEAMTEEDRGRFDIYAYRLYPTRFLEGAETELELPELDVLPLPASFERLGWDAVELVGDQPPTSFGCSPLSCNQQAALPWILRVNRHCLMDSHADAVELARRFSIEKPEPGPYCVVEVWRTR